MKLCSQSLRCTLNTVQKNNHKLVKNWQSTANNHPTESHKLPGQNKRDERVRDATAELAKVWFG